MTRVGCRSAIQYTNPRFITWYFCRQQISALASSPDDRDIPARVTTYALTSTCSTWGIGSGSWRSTPNPSLGTSAVGAKCQQGGSVTATTRHKSKSTERKDASVVIPYNTDSRQVGSRSRITIRPYHCWRCSHNWDGQSHTTIAIEWRST